MSDPMEQGNRTSGETDRMQRRRITLADGRAMFFYTFSGDPAAESPATESPATAAEESRRNEPVDPRREREERGRV